MSVDILLLIMIFSSIFVSMVPHEVAHGYVAKLLGDDTAHDEGRLSLNPLDHIDPFLTILLPLTMVAIGAPPLLAAKPVPIDSRNLKFGDFGSALVALAGPVTNLLLMIIAGQLLLWLNIAVGTVLFAWIEVFIAINAALFVFNLIPLPPLDGSRVLYSVAPPAVQRVMNTIESFGLAGVFVMVFFLYSVIGPVIGSIISDLVSLLTPLA